MAKLTDTELIVLSAAAARDDGIAVVPAKMNKAPASKVGASLVKRKLTREMRSKPGMPVWRQGRTVNTDGLLGFALKVAVEVGPVATQYLGMTKRFSDM